ncbi:MAG: sulfur carrier protein ThiS [Thermoplasmatota archaeon]
MSIVVNGRSVDYVPDESVNRLLKRMRYLFPLVVVKVDGKIVPRELFIRTKLHDGAIVEVIHLTSGG